MTLHQAIAPAASVPVLTPAWSHRRKLAEAEAIIAAEVFASPALTGAWELEEAAKMAVAVANAAADAGDFEMARSARMTAFAAVEAAAFSLSR